MQAFPAVFGVGFTTGAATLVFGLALTGVWPASFAWAAAVALTVAAFALVLIGRQPRATVAAPSDGVATTEALDQLREDFLATLSHELRTPLNAMIGWVHLLRMNAPVDHGRALDAIERNARQQARLIDDLLDVSQMLKGGLTLDVVPMDLLAAARASVQAMQSLASAKDVTIVFRAPHGRAVVDGDDARLQQAIRNLISNAIKFTPTGGRVEVTVTQEAEAARLEVRDFGQGVDPAFVPYMFKLFSQGPAAGVRAGLGLGLSIVEEIVRQHHGQVSARSGGRGLGTSISMVLPVHAGPGLPEPQSASPPSAPRPADYARGTGRMPRIIRSTAPDAGPAGVNRVPGPWAAASTAAVRRVVDRPPASSAAGRPAGG